MDEIGEFAEALMDQLQVEINEEKEIQDLSNRIKEDKNFKTKFETLENLAKEIFPVMTSKITEFTGLQVREGVQLEFPELNELKMLKGKKVFASDAARDFIDKLFLAISGSSIEKISELIKKDTAKFLVYSTYAKAYISKISTTYGDYLDSKIYLNKFVLSSYPQIILYKHGIPYEANYENVNSGYKGALKMTILEELIHSVQENLQSKNKIAVVEVNAINEELAKTILNLDDSTASNLSEYLKLEPVPDDFPTAKRANLFFMLNPDNFIVNVLGPDVMTFNKVEIDPKISEMVPSLLDIYQRWLKPIQTHHALFTTMEGMAEFAVQNILKDDINFQNYLTTFVGTDPTSYQIRKSMGKDFTKFVFEKFGQETFKMLLENSPSTRELKEPQLYLNRLKK